MTKDKLANKIKNLREKLNMSQERFGKKIGVTGKTISAYECGRCIPPMRVLERFSEIYSVTFITSAEKSVKLSDQITKLKDMIRDIETQLDSMIS